MNSFSVRSVQTNINILPPVHPVIPSMPNSEHSPQWIKKREKKILYRPGSAQNEASFISVSNCKPTYWRIVPTVVERRI